MSLSKILCTPHSSSDGLREMKQLCGDFASECPSTQIEKNNPGSTEGFEAVNLDRILGCVQNTESYQVEWLRSMVFQRTIVDPDYPLNDHHPPLRTTGPSPVMVHVQIVHVTDISSTPDDGDPDPDVIPAAVEAGLCFWSEIGLFRSNQESRFNFFSPKFASLGIASPYHRRLTNKISREIISCPRVLEPGRMSIALPVIVVIRTIMSVANFSEWVLYERSTRESIEEFERMNLGMVPAATESLAMVQKSVKVGEKSSCTICLEDLGEFASAMPCKHMFHDECIVTWLKQSHYCPVCRFELPTDVAET